MLTGRSRRRRAPWLSALVVAALTSSALACSSGGSERGDPTPSTRSAATTTTWPTSPFRTVDEAVASKRPVVLAHAGGENIHPHSTLYAYEEAVNEGVDILDFDVRLTKDGVLVIFHDDTVDRTTNGTGRVDEMTWDQLHALDAAYWFTETCSACDDQPADAYVLRGVRTGKVPPPKGHTADDFAPTKFETVVEKFPDFVLNIEIKGTAADAIPAAQELARILKRHHKLDSSVVTAFDDTLADAFHEAAPEVAITPGLAAMTQYVLAKTPLPQDRRILQIPPDYEGTTVLTPELVERAHADGKVLWIWPNSRDWETAAGYRKLLDMGVDGINAADPDTAVKVAADFP